MELDFVTRGIELISDAFTIRRYKSMNPGLAIASGLLVIPFFIAFLAFWLAYFILACVHKFLKYPLDYFLAFIKKESSGVQHATQAVIYFIAFPFVVSCQIFLLLIVVVLNLLHLISLFFAKIWTLNGTNCNTLMSDCPKRVYSSDDSIETSLVLTNILIGYASIIAVAICFIVFGASIEEIVYPLETFLVYNDIALIAGISISIAFVVFETLFTLIFLNRK